MESDVQPGQTIYACGDELSVEEIANVWGEGESVLQFSARKAIEGSNSDC